MVFYQEVFTVTSSGKIQGQNVYKVTAITGYHGSQGNMRTTGNH